MAEYKYYAFISYSSKDKPWAERLHRELEKSLGGKRVFLDTERLEAGKPWNKQLQDAIATSEHIVVFYSDNAHGSDWVKHEMTAFNMLAGDDFGVKRRLLCVLTRDSVSPTVYPQIQSLKGLLEGEVYTNNSADTLADDSLATWNKVVDQLVGSIRSNTEPLPLALVTMNSSEADTLAWDQLDPGERLSKTLGTFAASLDIPDLNAFRKLYGPTREDWKPFGSNQRIEDLLRDVLADINKWTPARRFAWDQVEFLVPGMSIDAVKAEISRLARPSVVLIDPLSLYHRRVANRVALLDQVFARDDVVFLTLTPFCIGSAYHTMRSFVRDLTAPLLDPYFNPQPAKITALCNMGVSDLEDLRRTILHAMGRGPAQTAVSRSPYLAPPKRI